MDQVFDSVNGSSVKPDKGKMLRCAITKSSIHIEFWNEAINVFNSMKFVTKDGKISTPLCVKNWIITLQSLKYIWGKVNTTFKFLSLRNINQDPLESTFGAIRSHGVRNINPTTIQFVSSFKTLLINNFSSIKSIGNCEINETGDVLDNLKQFLMLDENILPTNTYYKNENAFTLPVVEHKHYNSTTHIGDMTMGYVTGYLARSIIKIVKQCRICKKILICGKRTNPLINCRAYTSKNLTDPSLEFINLVKDMLSIYSNVLPKICFQNQIGQKLNFLIEMNTNFSYFKCPIHELKEIIKCKFIQFVLFNFCKNTNKILKGVDKHFDKSVSTNLLAFNYYIKHKGNKNKK